MKPVFPPLVLVLTASAPVWLPSPLMAAETGTATQEPAGQVIRAVYTPVPPVLDGRLDEAPWKTAPIAGEFVQSEPREGHPLTERTEVRVLFDADTLYIGAFCFDSDPARIIVNELKRDFDSREGDAFGVAIDVHHDRRNSFSFFTNPGSAKRDAQSLDDGRHVNLQWDGVWQVASRTNGDGWVAEIAIPFRTLGLRREDVQSMGINFKRRIRRKNEEGYWSPIPRRFTITYVSLAGTLAGLEALNRGTGLQVKPFATTDIQNGSAGHDVAGAKFGADAKYRLSTGLALDVTYNTDFSHVEADTQQVNLTRFSPFFPEKREFFLENSAIFAFGDTPGERSGRQEDTQLFYSRRIGLSPAGEPLRLRGGARLSGHAGRWSLGLLGIRQDASLGVPASTFTVARVRRDVFGRSNVGVIVVSREGATAGDFNRAYGADLNLRKGQNWTANAFWAATSGPDLRGGNTHTKLSSAWDNGVFDAQVIFADIGAGFRPEVGFVPRTDVRNYQWKTGIRLRPTGTGLVREWDGHIKLIYFTDRRNVTLTKDEHYALAAEFRDGSRFKVSYDPQFERLTTTFALGQGVSVNPGDYHFDLVRLSYNTNRSKLFSTSANLVHGGFYDGDRTSVSVVATLLLKPSLRAALSYESNRVTLPAGRLRADLYIASALYSLSPRLFVDTLVQFNAQTERVLATARLNFTYRPLSDFAIVVNEQRSTAFAAPPAGRTLIVKYTRLLQF